MAARWWCIMTTHIGIDPGASGAIAWIDGEGAHSVKLKTMTERDVFDLLTSIRVNATEVFATLEAVHAMPRQGVASTFKFGMSYGGLRMALVAACIPFETVTPAKWQGAMSCRTKGDKNVTKRRAQELFPTLKITHANADALLIAEHGRRHEMEK
jgi:crossover junction endodeoxyribonuclease RuvC